MEDVEAGCEDPAVDDLPKEPKPPMRSPPMRGAPIRGALIAGERAMEPRGVIVVPCGPIVSLVTVRPACMLPPWTGTLVTMRPGLPPNITAPEALSRIATGLRGIGLTGTVG